MIRKITVTNHIGESLELELTSPEKSGLAVLSVDGLGPGKADINISDIATSDGGVFNSARLNTRDITLKLRYIGVNIEAIRQKTYKYFPMKKLIKLTVETDNRTAYVCGYVEKNEPDIFSKKSGCNILITCPDPFYYSLDDLETVFSGVVPAFEFPFENNSLIEPLLEMGNIVTKQYEVVNYQGESEIGVTIVIHSLGTVGTIKIYNIDTRQSIEISEEKLKAITGSGIIANDTITICSLQGQKSITLLRNGVETNILNCLGRSIEWFKLRKGDNIFAYTAEEGASNLQFKVISKIIYEGV